MGVASKWKSSLPVILNKAKREQLKSEDIAIIEKLSHDTSFQVDSVNFFKYVTTKKYNKDSFATAMVLDINDMSLSNRYNGREDTDRQIGKMIEGVKEALSSQGEYNIAKMGDEIYVYIPKKDKEDVAMLFSQILQIKSKSLSFSGGMATGDITSKTMQEMFLEAEQAMHLYKKDYKVNVLKETYKKRGYDMLLSHLLLKNFQKSRLFLKMIKQSANQKDVHTVIENFTDAIGKNQVEQFIASTLHPGLSHPEKSQSEPYEKYEHQSKKIFGPFDKQAVYNHAKALALKHTHIPGTICEDYFDRAVLPELTTNQPVDLLTYELSGLKKINDAYGYDKGNEAISDSLSTIQQALETNDVTALSGIVLSFSGSGYMLLEHSDKKEDILNYINNFSSGLRIYASLEKVEIPRAEDIKQAMQETRKQLQERLFRTKINDKDTYELIVQKIYQDAFDLGLEMNDDVNGIKKDLTEKLQEILLEPSRSGDAIDCILQDISTNSKEKDNNREIET